MAQRVPQRSPDRLRITMTFNLMKLSCVLLAALFIANIAQAAPPSPAGNEPVKVLLLDGFSNHNWQLNTALIRGILEPTGLFAVTVSTSPPKADSPGWDEWRPKFSDYDVVIQTCNDIGG